MMTEEQRKMENIKKLQDAQAMKSGTGADQTTLQVAQPQANAGGGSPQLSQGLGGAAEVNKSSGGSGAATGALSGAAMGASVGGPWGAAIGAVVGGVAGVMGDRKKKEDERRAKVLKGLQYRMEGEQQAGQQLQTGTQNALNMQLSGIGRALS